MTLKRAIIIVTSAVAIGAGLGALSAYIVPPAHAADSEQLFPCGAKASADAMAEALGGTPFVTLTPEQWQFMRGVAIMVPDTPNQLPPGDAAAMSMRPDGTASIIFLDGGLACAPFKLGPDGVAVLLQVGRGEIAHAAHHHSTLGGPTL